MKMEVEQTIVFTVFVPHACHAYCRWKWNFVLSKSIAVFLLPRQHLEVEGRGSRVETRKPQWPQTPFVHSHRWHLLVLPWRLLVHMLHAHEPGHSTPVSNLYIRRTGALFSESTESRLHAAALITIDRLSASIALFVPSPKTFPSPKTSLTYARHRLRA